MKPELIAAMQAAHDAGLSTFPLGANKRPAIREWAWLMERQPELDQLLIWQASDYSGYAVVMGGPERLLAIDLEAAFVAEHMIEFAQRLMDAECYATWINWMEGLMVTTPSEGLHVVIHLMGNDPMPGNEKLASDSSGHCLAETRGQGGYIVGYGSNGNVHPSGKPWIPASGGYDSICWAETEEWAAVKAVLVSFDEAPPVPAPAPPAARPGPGGVTLGELERSSSWIERIEMPDLVETLAHYGYVPDRLHENWTRPGKDPRLGHSATVNASGRLIMWSSNDRIPMSGNPPTTYDAADVIAFNEGVSRLDVLRRWRPERSETPAPLAGLYLPGEFWSATPYLQHVHDAALSGFIPISPDLVWMAVKTIYAATIPWNIRIEGRATFDYIGLMVGGSGSGKTSARSAALELLPPSLFGIDGVNLTLPPGTGEGITEHFITRSSKGAQEKIWPRAGSFYVDEGKWLFNVSARSGTTVMEAVRSAWSGQLTGSLAATGERHRLIPPMGIRTSFLIGIQPLVAARLLRDDLTDEGLPQRVTWAWAYHPEVDTAEREHPGPLQIPVYDHHHWGGVSEPTLVHELRVDPELRSEIRSRAVARRRGDPSPHEGHADLACLKSAAIHAMLSGDGHTLPMIQYSEWNLARTEWETSRLIREHVARTQAQAISQESGAAGKRLAERDIAALHVHLENAIQSLVRKVASSPDGINKRQAKDHLRAYRARYQLTHTEIIEVALAQKRVIERSDGLFGIMTPPGGVRGS